MFRFDLAFQWLLTEEGGYVNDARDNGGVTNHGVTIGTLRRWRREQGKSDDLTEKDVRELTLTEARLIYKTWYWDPIRGDELPFGLALVMFDGSVHSGPRRSIMFLQQALRLSAADGVLGPRTMAALRRGDTLELCRKVLGRRGVFLSGHEDFAVYGFGWLTRLLDVYERARKLDV